MSEFQDACRIILREGYTPVQTAAYERLRAWLDLVGWPPKEWGPVALAMDVDENGGVARYVDPAGNVWTQPDPEKRPRVVEPERVCTMCGGDGVVGAPTRRFICKKCGGSGREAT